MSSKRPQLKGETELSNAIRARLGWESGLLLHRNAQCAVVKSNRMVRGGLGNGSPDIIGLVTMRFVTTGGEAMTFGRGFALEIKSPGQIPSEERIAKIRAKAPARRDKDELRDLAQWEWLEEYRRFGGFGAYADSVQAAVDAVTRARDGESQ